MKPVFSEAEAYLIALNKERTAYRTPVEKEYVEIKVTTPCSRKHYPVKQVDEKRDQMMFNAGRFAAGARDNVALKAHSTLMGLLDGEA